MPLLNDIVIGLSIPPTILTITGNTVFFITLLKTPSLHTPSNVLLGALCLTDLLVGVLNQPLNMSILLSNPGPCCSPLMKAYNYSFCLSSFFSFTMSLLIILDRYVAIRFPLFYLEYATCRKYIDASIGLFVLSMTYAVVIEERLHQHSQATFWSVRVGLQLLLILALLIMYALVSKVALNQQKRIASMPGKQRSRLSRREKSRTYTVIIIITVFIACYVPYTAYGLNMLLYYLGKNAYSLAFALWANYIVLFHSCFNPMIYCARSRKIRRAAYKIFFPTLAYRKTYVVAMTEATWGAD